MKTNKPHMNTMTISEKTTTSIVPNINTIVVAIDNHMAVIQMQIGRNMIDEFFWMGNMGLILLQNNLDLG
jgi:hypothetical protein